MKIENHKLRLQDIIRKAMMAWDMELSDFLEHLFYVLAQLHIQLDTVRQILRTAKEPRGDEWKHAKLEEKLTKKALEGKVAQMDIIKEEINRRRGWSYALRKQLLGSPKARGRSSSKSEIPDTYQRQETKMIASQAQLPNVMPQLVLGVPSTLN